MSPDQAEAAQRWADGARDALDTAERLWASQKYHHALFFCHLAVEKAFKARYIALHGAMPPYTHDLRLLASHLNHGLTAVEPALLAELSTFNVAGRYQEDKLEFYRRATPAYATQWLERTRSILKALLE